MALGTSFAACLWRRNGAAVQLTSSLFLFRIGGESIHSVYRKGFHDLLDTGKNCYYRLMTRATIDWRKLLLGMINDEDAAEAYFIMIKAQKARKSA